MHKEIVQYVASRYKKHDICSGSARQLRARLRTFEARWPNLEPSKITKRHIEGWQSRPDLSPAYLKSRLSTMRGFCEWLIDEKVLTRNPCRGMKPPRQPKYAPRNLTHAEVAAVLAACPDTRARLMVSLMVQEGLRRAEVAAAQTGDIDWHRGTLGVRGKNGEGNITRHVPITDETMRVLKEYVTTLGTGPVIRSYRDLHSGLNPDSVGFIVTQVMRDAGVKLASRDGRSPHAFRHTCATDVLDGCDDILVVRDLLGHQSVRTTEIYTAGRVTHLREPMAGRTYA